MLRIKGSPLGLHRVIDPAGTLPQAAWRLDPSPELWPDETRVRVDRLNLDAASAADAHYGGNLVDGAYVLALFGDVATEACIRMAGDEGLFASYSDVQFKAPVLGGDVIEVTATVVRAGRRSRELSFEARVVCGLTRSGARRRPGPRRAADGGHRPRNGCGARLARGSGPHQPPGQLPVAGAQSSMAA